MRKMQMMKVSFSKVKYVFFVYILLFCFSSCNLFEEVFNEPVKEYFKEYTETAGIMRWEITKGEWHEDTNGRISLSSSQDVEVSLYLRNPQNFYFSENNAELDFSALDNSQVKNTFGSEAEESLVTISQDSNDNSILTLKYPSEFLSQTETGFEISPKISLSHPVSQIPFATYSDLKLYSNSAPPPVLGAAVYKDSDKYVLFFNMPEKSLLKGIHKDITSISVTSSKGDEYESSITVNSDGTFSFSNSSSFNTGNISSDSKYTPSSDSVTFVEKDGQAAYLVTKDKLSDQNTTYTITLKDKAGLSSFVVASANSTKLGDVSVLDSSGKTISTNSSGICNIEQNIGSSYATVTFSPAKTAGGQNTADSKIVYKIYQGSDSTGKLIASGESSGGDFKYNLPAGEVFAQVYARKDLFADSEMKEYKFFVARATLYVSPNGNDDKNNGSQDSPFKTIKKAIDSFTHLDQRGTIYLDGDLTEDVTLDKQNAKLSITGNGHSVQSLTMSTAGGTLTATNFSVTGNISVTSGNATFSGGSGKGGDVSVSGGILNLSLASGNLKNVSVSSGTATLTGATISENVTASGNLTLTNATVNGNISVTNNAKVTLNNGSVKGTVTVSKSGTNGATLETNNVTITGPLKVDGGIAKLSGGSVEEDITIDQNQLVGILEAKNVTIKGDVTYKSGQKLLLEGSTTVASGKKITLNKNCTISVKNLSAPKVAEIADSSASKNWGGWTNGATILTSESGNMSDDIISKFTLNDSNKVRVLKVGTDNKSAVLGLRTTFYVSASGNDSDGSSEQSAFKTVQQAIEKIKTAEGISHNSLPYIINVSGSVTGPADFSQSFTVNMPTILLEGKNSATITATNSQVIKMPTLNSESFFLSISGLTLSGGSTTQDGSIMSIPQNARVSLSNCTITNNTVGQKGAVYVSGGTLILGGTVNITGNKTSSNPNQAANVYLANGKTITLNTAGTPTNPSFIGNSRVGVTTDTKPTSSTSVQITSNTGNGFISSFISDEGYTVVQEETGATGLYLKLSGGSLDIDKPKNVEFKLSPESVTSDNLTITVTATADGKDITNELSDWNLSMSQGSSPTIRTSTSNSISVDSPWPTGTYQLSVSAKYGTYTYGGTYNFEKK